MTQPLWRKAQIWLVLGLSISVLGEFPVFMGIKSLLYMMAIGCSLMTIYLLGTLWICHLSHGEDTLRIVLGRHVIAIVVLIVVGSMFLWTIIR